MAYVYRHIRLDKNEPFYIGIGSDTNGKYIRAHYTHSRERRNKHWYNITQLTNYDVEILIDNLTWDEACEKEKEFIKLYGRKDLGLGSLTNKTNGGDGRWGSKATPETKEKQRIAKLGKYCGENHPMFGKHHSDETKNKLSEIGRTKIGTLNNSSLEIFLFDIFGNFIRNISNGRELAKELNCSFQGISKAAIGKNKTIKNHIVIYKKDFTNELLKEKVNVITFKP